MWGNRGEEILVQAESGTSYDTGKTQNVREIKKKIQNGWEIRRQNGGR